MTSMTEFVTAVADPWRYGWRYVRRLNPGGVEELVQVPLQEEDLLHPQEEDFIVQTPLHVNLCLYFKETIGTVILHRPGYVVLCDCRVDWGVEGIKPHGPDVSAFANFTGWDPSAGTFHVGELGAAPLAVIEVTSPDTRKNDFGVKLVQYHQAGIPVYVIVDLHPDNGEPPPQIFGYQWAPKGYELLPLDERGRLKIESLGVWIGVEDGEVFCYGPDGNRMAPYPELFGTARSAKAQAQEAAERAGAEAAARAAAETRIRELEAENERLRKAKTNGKNGP